MAYSRRRRTRRRGGKNEDKDKTNVKDNTRREIEDKPTSNKPDKKPTSNNNSGAEVRSRNPQTLVI